MSVDANAGVRTSAEVIEPLIFEAARNRRNVTKDDLVAVLAPALPELAKAYKIRLMAIKAATSVLHHPTGETLDDVRARIEEKFMQFALADMPVEALRGFVAECTEEKLIKYRKDSFVQVGNARNNNQRIDANDDDDGVKTTALQRSISYLKGLLAQLCGDKTRPVLAQVLVDALNDSVTVDARLRAATQEVVRQSEQNKVLWLEYSAMAAGVLPVSCQGTIAIASARTFCNEVALRYCQVLLEINHNTKIDMGLLRSVLADTVEANLNQALSGSLAAFVRANESIMKGLHSATATTPKGTTTAAPPPAPPTYSAPPPPTPQPQPPPPVRARVCYWCQATGHEVAACPAKAAGAKKVKPTKFVKRTRTPSAPKVAGAPVPL